MHHSSTNEKEEDSFKPSLKVVYTDLFHCALQHQYNQLPFLNIIGCVKIIVRIYPENANMPVQSADVNVLIKITFIHSRYPGL